MTGRGKIWNGLLTVQRMILFITGCTVILGISASAAMRYIFRVDFYGMEDVILITSFWMYFIGAAYGAYERSHITAEIIPIYIKNLRLKAVLALITSFITTALSWVFTSWGFLLFKWGIETNGQTGTMHIPLIVPHMGIILGAILMSFYFTVNLIEDIRAYMRLKERDFSME